MSQAPPSLHLFTWAEDSLPSGIQSIFFKYTPARLVRIICLLKEKIKFLQTTTKYTACTGQAWGTAAMRNRSVLQRAACELALVWLSGHIPLAAPTQHFSQRHTHRSCISCYMSRPSARHRHSIADTPWRSACMHSRPELDSLVPGTSPEVLLQRRHRILVCSLSSNPSKTKFPGKKTLMAPGILSHL